jgi:FAD/FMN-containing dehydrogenase
VGAADTAFARRDTLFLLAMDTSWNMSDSQRVVSDNLAWLADLHEQMRPFTSDAAYLNFTDPDLIGWRSAYHGANLPRLAAVKRRYDPDRVFGAHQAI